MRSHQHSLPNQADLGLAGASRSAIGLDTSGLDVLAVNDGARVGKRSLGHSADSLAASGALPILLVGGEVEGDEEEEVRAENTDTGEGSKLLTRALAGGGHPGPVSRSEVSVRREVDEAFDAKLVTSTKEDREGHDSNLPRSMTNWIIWRRVIHSFHQILTPRALWK